MIVGLVKPTSGKITLDGKDITNDAMYKRAQKGIGYLAQEASVFRKLSVEDNILGVLQLTNKSKEEQIRRTNELIEEFSLEHVRKNRGTCFQEVKDVEPKSRIVLLNRISFCWMKPLQGESIAVKIFKKIKSLVKKDIGV